MRKKKKKRSTYSSLRRFYRLTRYLASEWTEPAKLWIESFPSSSTKETYANDLLNYINFIKKEQRNYFPRKIETLTSDYMIMRYHNFIIAKFKVRSDYKIVSSTARRKITTLTSFFNALILQGLHKGANPTKQLPKLQIAKPRPTDILNQDEVGLVLTQLEIEKNNARTVKQKKRAMLNELVFSLFISTGIRPETLAFLRLCDYVPGPRPTIYTVGKRQTISKRELNRECADLLDDYINQWRRLGKPTDYIFTTRLSKERIDYKRVKESVIKSAARAGIKKNITPRSLRKTIACMLYLANYPIEQIQSFLDHKDPTTTKIYVMQALSQIMPIGLELSLKDLKSGRGIKPARPARERFLAQQRMDLML